MGGVLQQAEAIAEQARGGTCEIRRPDDEETAWSQRLVCQAYEAERIVKMFDDMMGDHHVDGSGREQPGFEDAPDGFRAAALPGNGDRTPGRIQADTLMARIDLLQKLAQTTPHINDTARRRTFTASAI